MPGELLAAALRYAELGYPVFPCAPGTKTPLTEHGFHDASVNPEQIERWWTQHPSANIGIPTAGLVVIDSDGEANPWPADPEHAGHHELWMSFGGAGHSGLWGLNINERQDHGNRRWEVEVLSASEASARRVDVAHEQSEQRKQRQQQSRDEKHRPALLNALRLYPDGETPRVIRETAALSGAVATRQLSRLMAEGLVEECLVKEHPVLTRKDRMGRRVERVGFACERGKVRQS